MSSMPSPDQVQRLLEELYALGPDDCHRGVLDGLRTVSHLLDCEALLKVRALLLRRCPDDRESLQLIDRALAERAARDREES